MLQAGRRKRKETITATAILRNIRGLILDFDGTLARGSQPLPGLVPFFSLLRQRGIALTVVTNNTVKTPAQYRDKLAAFGVHLALDELLTAAVATARYLAAQLPPAAPLFMIGELGLRVALSESGFTLIETDQGGVAAVVVGGDRHLNYDKLKHAIQHVRRGARFVGTNPDLLVPAEDGLVPEAGVTLAAIQAATGVQPVVIGKPERPLFDLALARMGIAAEHAAIIGDRLDTDILGGQRAGLTSILVTTGVDDAAAIREKGIHPDLVVSGLDALSAIWSQVNTHS